MSKVPPGEIHVVERLDFLSIDLELVQILQQLQKVYLTPSRRPDFVWKIGDFQALHAWNPKIVNFEDKILIFFPVKAEMMLFPNLKKGGH